MTIITIRIKFQYMETTLRNQTFFRRIIALPTDHGSWVFLFSPLLIGLVAGGHFSLPSIFMIIAALTAFLIRQPVTMAIKSLSGRRPRSDLPAAVFWTGIYSLFGLAALAGLILQGFGYLLYLALPGLPVFAWHLYLVSKRSERRQAGVEIVGSGVLCLAAPAAYWVGSGWLDPNGWWLFTLVWFQSAASIVYAYMRLEQRVLTDMPDRATSLRMGSRALYYTSFNLLVVLGLSITRILPPLLPLAFAPQWIAAIWGTFHPAIRMKPTVIGIRQTIISSLFTILFITAWIFRF
jgi:hypothetical protein